MHMYDQKGRVLEVVLNMVSLVAIAFLSVGLVLNHLEKTAGNARATVIKLGEPVPMADVDFTSSRMTLVLALSTSCHFCTESAPFYRALLAQSRNGEFQTVAVLPQPTASAKQYIESGGYSVAAIRQLGLEKIGVSATPTLLLVDEKGRLVQQWIGRLSASEERDVAFALGIKQWSEHRAHVGSARSQLEPGTYSPVISTEELVALLARERRVNLLDVRERADFSYGHLSTAVSIPADELAVRAPHELDPDLTTVVYCRFSAACLAGGMPSLCSYSTDQLTNARLTKVRVVRDPLPLLMRAGVPITGAYDRP